MVGCAPEHGGQRDSLAQCKMKGQGANGVVNQGKAAAAPKLACKLASKLHGWTSKQFPLAACCSRMPMYLLVDVCAVLYESLEGLNIAHLGGIMQGLRPVLQARGTQYLAMYVQEGMRVTVEESAAAL